MRSALRWCRRRPRLTAGLTLLLLVVLFNLAAYRQAYGLTHFQPDGAGPTLWDGAARLWHGAPLPRPRNRHDPSAVGLPFEVHTFAGRAGRLEAWYVPRPHAQGVVLLLHGYGGCKGQLLDEARAFHDLGYACFLLDFPGSGGSEGDATTIGCLEAVDVARAAEYVHAHWPGRLILYGHSMGATAALRALAVEGVTADAAVLECPFDRLLRAVEARVGLGPASGPIAWAMVFWGGVQHGFNGFEHNPVDYAARVRCPTLLQQGSTDHRVSVAEAELIFARLAGPRRLHVYEGVGHGSYVAEREAEWRREVGDFLKQFAGEKEK
jgi:alpha-beta hydrolase superfamily lysophospholipase